jgi:integrase
MTSSVLLKLAQQYLTLTRCAARRHVHPDDEARDRGKLGYQKNLLNSFVQFWSARKCPWPIRSALVLDWVAEGTRPEKPYRDRHRMLAISGFLTHLRTIEPGTEVSRHPFRKPPRRTPRLLTDQEIASLINATARLRACSKFRRATMATLLGILASTGLRIGEALRLREDEVHLDAEPPYLTISDTKFGKSRIVVLHPTSVLRLRKFSKLRATALRDYSPPTFFANESGKSLAYNPTQISFRRLLRHAGIIRVDGEKAVTLHSFRHAFAVRRLTLWHKAGENVAELIPYLSVYMGHLNPKDTYWYLSATAELLEAAASRFENHYAEAAAQ